MYELLPEAAYALWRNDVVQASLSAIGAGLIGVLACRLIFALWAFARPNKRRIAHYRSVEAQSWALVTGASDGIGLAFSEDLLGRGFNVLLHGRNAEKLDRVKNDLLKQYPSRGVEVVVADAALNDDGYTVVADKARRLPGKLTVIHHNVGGVVTRPQYLSTEEIPHADINTQINVNARFPTQLTRALLPTLRANAPSIIMFSGSTGALMGVPYLTTYIATKAYIQLLAVSLSNELFADDIHDVDVKCFLIGNTASSNIKDRMPLTISSQECARACLDKAGSGDVLVYSHWKHYIQIALASFIPDGLMKRGAAKEMKARKERESKAQ